MGNFNFFWVGQSISVLGSQISMMAIPLIAINILNASSFDMGILYALETLPFFIFSLFAGALIDKNKKNLYYSGVI